MIALAKVFPASLAGNANVSPTGENMRTLLIKLLVIVAGAVLLVLWQNFIGVKIEGSNIARIAYIFGVGLFTIAIEHAGQQSVHPT